MKSNLSRSIAGLLLFFSLVSCSGSGKTLPQTITINGDKTDILIDEETILTAVVSPAEADQGIAWTLSDATLANIVVNVNVATIKGLNEGTLTVTATSSSLNTVFGTYNLTISAPVDNSYHYEGTLTVAPYTVYSQLNEVESTWNSMTRALHEAGQTGLSTNKNYVVDGNGLEIYRRGSKSTWWCYDGNYFVGSKPSTEAKTWGQTHQRSIVIDGQASGYVQLGSKEMVPDYTGANYELNAGAYNYMFSKPGVVRNETAGGNIPGYYFAEADVRLSEAYYRPAEGNAATDEFAQWNAYIFLNHADAYNIDLGLIGNYYPATNNVKWRMVRNCSYAVGHPDADGATFAVINPGVTIAEMTYNAATNDYRNAHDLHMEIVGTLDGITLKITDLQTQQEYVHFENHPGYKTEATTVYGRILLAASYCPVVGKVWDGSNGGYLKNVVFDHVRIGKYQANNEYPEAVLEDFYPDTENVNNGFAQGGEWADWRTGAHKGNGTYNSGLSYQSGEKWISFSTYYDGTHDVYDNYKF